MATVGRPSSYVPEFDQQAYKLCLLGAIDAELADFFGVSETTINNWKNEYPEFLESIKKGKATADAEVASSLYERAKGARWTEQQAIKVKHVKYTDGKRVSEDEEVVTVPVECASPPDTTACIFWLKNRKSSEWRDKVDLNHGGTIGVQLINDIPRPPRD